MLSFVVRDNNVGSAHSFGLVNKKIAPLNIDIVRYNLTGKENMMTKQWVTIRNTHNIFREQKYYIGHQPIHWVSILVYMTGIQSQATGMFSNQARHTLEKAKYKHIIKLSEGSDCRKDPLKYLFHP